MRRAGRLIPALVALVLAACSSADVAPTPSRPPVMSPSFAATPPAASPGTGDVLPAPGSDSVVYAPNPGSIVVAIDAGHGGCLDWGVPDPSERGSALAEKTLTLAIAERLRDLLEADGVGVVMIRDDDVALAGDDYPDLGCSGPQWRDVDGDGEAGFEESGRIRTRDELQARIDLANLARADAFVSIHINSLTQNGVVYEIAATQTFYDDETPWGVEGSGALAGALQGEVVEAIGPHATYERQDRGTEAVAYYAISRSWAEGDACETPGDTYCKPPRGLLMPSALTEVGSITLRAEHDLLASDEGQQAIAEGLFEGLADFLGRRELAARIGLVDGTPGEQPIAVAGDGPPFWPPTAPDGPVELRLTNTGVADWPPDMELVAAWEATEQPYLARPPEDLRPLGVEVPALEPGESVVLSVELPPAPAGRALAWISLKGGGATTADRGSPALQLSSQAP